MTHDTSPERISPPGSFEFEFTAIADARQVLDDFPSGAVRPGAQTPGYWEQRRRKPLPQDRALAGVTIDWLLALPQGLQPRALCEQYPRVANALAAVWLRPGERGLALDQLLTDARGKRKGFPARVRREIEALRGSLDVD